MGIESEKEGQALSYSEAMQRVVMLIQEAQMMGANDYEPSAFNRIQQQLEAGEITPTEAVRQAQGIVDAKLDYH